MNSDGAPKRRTIRERIQKRIDVCGYTVAQLEKELGLSRTYLNDFLGPSRKKNKLPDEIIAKLATKLRTSEIWLLREVGPEEAESSNARFGGDQSPKESIETVAGNDVLSVSKKERRVVNFLSLDITSGAATVSEEGSPSVIVQARVVDPEIVVPGNAYASALAARSPLKVVLKRVILGSGKENWFISDIAH